MLSNLEIIGEAMAQGMRHFPELEREISQAREIVDFRNQIIHGTMRVNNAMVWRILESNLPTSSPRPRPCSPRWRREDRAPAASRSGFQMGQGEYCETEAREGGIGLTCGNCLALSGTGMQRRRGAQRLA